MNIQEIELLRELRGENKELYGKLIGKDALIVYRLRKARGLE